ncbi:MAG: Ig-like domain-containing protein [Sediminibacterium sp.]|nr:Ig-like domain-containing protein [Sediminibacterium sp.]
MNALKKILLSLLIFGSISSMMSSCANIIPPSGGPRDSLPPRLLFAVPRDSALNTAPRLITMNFDEYVTLQNINENLIVSPTIPNMPQVDARLRIVTVRIKDSLDPNTTYSINFGTALRDINESNILKDFRYVFSTGKTIDNYSYSGKVFLAEKGKTDSTLIVILHKNLHDSAIVKERPRYYTRINGKGEFQFTNLSAGSYRVYVLPNDYTKKYDDSTKLFAFRSDTLLVSDTTGSDTLYAYQEFKEKPKPVKQPVVLDKSGKEDKRLRYISSLEGAQQDLLSSLKLDFKKPIRLADSAKIVLTDSNYRPLSGYKLILDTTNTVLSISYPWKEQQYFRLLLPKESITDTTGTTLPKTDTLRFSTKRESDYGSIQLRFSRLNLSRNPVLQFFQSDNLVESVPLNSFELTRKLFRQGSYEMRILYDTNKNGIWDPGSFGKVKKQPEVVQLIGKPLNVKANWDNEVRIEL